MRTAILILFVLSTLSVTATGQVYRLAELNTKQIEALPRDKTVIIMPGGVMEQHGPYLPSFSDGYMNEWWSERLAEQVASQPGWAAVLFPTIPLGDGGANEIGFRYVFPGTYGVRVKTLRSVYMDLGSELGEQGFKWILVVQSHGSPMHNLALDQASEYFRDTYRGGVMVNLFGLVFADSADPDLPAELRKENGIDIHSGASETSRIIFLKPNLVDVAYRRATPISVTDPTKFSVLAAKDDWPGYFGSPRLATPEFGKSLMEARLASAIKIVKSILNGADPAKLPRYADEAMKSEAQVADRAFAHDEALEKRQQAWLDKKGIK